MDSDTDHNIVGVIMSSNFWIDLRGEQWKVKVTSSQNGSGNQDSTT